MRKPFLRVAVALGILFGVTSLASAQTLPGPGWYTTAVIQNIGAEPATVHLDVYAQTGSAAPFTADITPAIPVGGNRVFFPGSGGVGGNVDTSSPLPGGFAGSMVVSSNQPVVAIGQVTNFQVPGFTPGTPGGYASEQYRGSAGDSSTISYPTVKHSFGAKTTIFTVQAAGQDVTATATINTSDGVAHTKQLVIAANRSVTFGPADGFSPPIQNTNCGSDPNTSPCFGALIVTGNNNIAGVALEYRDGQSPATVVQAASMFSASDVGSVIACPTIKNDFASNHRTTGVTVANTSNAAVSVTGEFTVAQGSSPVGTKFTQGPVNIPAGKAFVFGALNNTVGGMPAGNLASGKFTASASGIVAVTAETNISGSPVKQTIYNCFNPANATARAAAPVVKRNFGNNTTGITVQNANDSGAFVINATYVCDGGANTYGPIASPSLQPGAGFTFFQPAEVPAGKLCAVSLDGGGTNKVIAIINESSDFFPGTPQFNLNTKNYEAFNL